MSQEAQEQAPTVDTPNQAVGLLIQATQIAQKRGAFNLEEAALLSQAVNLLTPEPPPSEEETTEEESE